MKKLPVDFNWKYYIKINNLNLKTFIKAKYHYLNIGSKKNLSYKNNLGDEEFRNAINVNFIKLLKNNVIKENKYNLNYNYDEINSNRKLIYKINCKRNESIKINNSNIVIFDKDSLYNIYLEDNKYIEYIDNKKGNIYDKLDNIEYNNNELYDVSVIIPLSLCNLTHESLINFDYNLKQFLNSSLNINICISHTEKNYFTFLDKIIEENNINYIFVKNQNYFNLGYCRNLWKYINNSKKIMCVDIDIPLNDNILENLIKESKNYDIVKPYHNRLINLSIEEKYNYINYNFIPNKNLFYLFTITGGITLFDKKVLLETGGYEEYNIYGYEDRCFDVIILESNYSIKKIDNILIHLYHPKDENKNGFINREKIEVYNKKYYNCFYSKENKIFLHDFCNHEKKYLEYNKIFNKFYNYDLNLFNKISDSINLKNRNNKILIFTDSRGEHKASFSNEKIFTEKLKEYFEKINVEVDLMLCPFSWTSIVDFIECIENKLINMDEYDFVILYTGVVEYSPRPLSNYEMTINGNNHQITLKRLLDRIDKFKDGRICNNKNIFFEKFFEDKLIKSNPIYETKYKGEKTKSLVSLEMYENIVIPYLQKYDNKLIFINSNSCVRGWEGNYLKINPDGRPKNINIIEEYSKLTRNKFKYYIDLLDWKETEIKKYTVDNMHLSYEGSEFIYNELIKLFEKGNKN